MTSLKLSIKQFYWAFDHQLLLIKSSHTGSFFSRDVKDFCENVRKFWLVIYSRLVLQPMASYSIAFKLVIGKKYLPTVEDQICHRFFITFQTATFPSNFGESSIPKLKNSPWCFLLRLSIPHFRKNGKSTSIFAIWANLRIKSCTKGKRPFFDRRNFAIHESRDSALTPRKLSP